MNNADKTREIVARYKQRIASLRHTQEKLMNEILEALERGEAERKSSQTEI